MNKSVLALAQYHIDHKLPFVIYKKPLECTIEFIGQLTDTLYEFGDEFSEGFVMAPFDENKPAYIIRNEIKGKDVFDFEDCYDEKLSDLFTDGQEQHVLLVTKAIETIRNSDIVKIVLSRVEEIQMDNLNLLTVFKQMAHLYQNAFVYLWYHPKVGYWSGASPELLLKSNEQSFMTMALAGTQVDNGMLKPIWGEKEIEEQQMVTSFIQSELQPICSEFKIGNTQTVKAGKLLHLKTDIQGKLSTPFQINHLIASLHPTPAVCGLPKLTSKAFILANEGYDREFYTGYLGLISKSQAELYVNLRCFSYVAKQLKIYVGGGITEKSIPEKEWLETVEKSKTIKNLLFNGFTF